MRRMIEMHGFCRKFRMERGDKSVIRLENSGLPICFDDQYELHFEEGLACGGDGMKKAGDMRGLLYSEEDLKDGELCYSFYRDIVFEKHKELFRMWDYRYDITVIMPGCINGECKKTSGHYHGLIPGQPYTYPEIYEVLEGEITFLLQKTGSPCSCAADGYRDGQTDFCRRLTSERPEYVKAVRVKAGQAVVIPPFCGHASVNTGEGAGIFGNIAVAGCRNFYEPVREKHGLSYYILRENEKIGYRKNERYGDLPKLEITAPLEDEGMGIVFGKPVYCEFVKTPEKFEYLRRPEKYMDRMEKMLEKR